MSETEPIYMLNALWFNKDGGAAKYAEYARAVQPLLAKYGGEPLAGYEPNLSVIGEFDADLVFFVRWPSWETFQQFAADKAYAPVRPLREAALEKSLLIRCSASAFA